MQRKVGGQFLSARTSPWREVVAVAACLAILAGSAAANITVTGNKAGAPPRAVKDPCPAHGVDFSCSSTLVPSEVTLISDPTAWFKATLEAKYPGEEWVFHYMGGNDNMKGTFDVVYYEAYNECPKDLGAKIEVNFVPTADSLIQDVLWIQTVKTNFRGSDESLVDDRALLVSMGNLAPGKEVMYGPFYPFQDEDEDPPQWQADYLDGAPDSYDYLYDKSGFSCPTPGTTKYANFETYATWWDDYFKADGTIEDRDGDGHHDCDDACPNDPEKIESGSTRGSVGASSWTAFPNR